METKEFEFKGFAMNGFVALFIEGDCRICIGHFFNAFPFGYRIFACLHLAHRLP